jgi:WD40 repeat protein
MLEKDPAGRIPSMRLVGAELEAIQASRPLTLTRVPSGPLPACPYRGLFAFREEDAPFFFGRETFTQRLVTAVDKGWLVAVVGPSGSGKSSTVYAGLLPHLRQQAGWGIVAFRPGGEPLQVLAYSLMPWLEQDLTETERLIEARKLGEALGCGELPLGDVVARILEKQAALERLLLLADQFEEIYTLCADTEQRTAFLDVLLNDVELPAQAGAPAPTLVLTLRADFVEQALSFRLLADALQNSQLVMGPMPREELERAVTGPAQLLGVGFEAGLVERILDDVGDEPGNLPLLEFALTMLWEHEPAWQLSHEAYEAIGRVEGALTRYADQVYDQLAPGEQAAAQRIFTQLVRPGEGTEDTRRVTRRAELGDADWGMVRRLADARLVVTSRDAAGHETVELAHEALINGWGRLRDWMQQDRTFRSWQERLRVALAGWETGGHDEGTLLRGAPLAEAEGWLARRTSSLSPAELSFVKASVALREQQELERERQRQRELKLERRGRRLLAIIAGVLAVAVVVTLGFTVYSLVLRRQALEAYSLSVAANARELLDGKDTVTALELALAANQIHNPPLESQRTLMDAAYAPGAGWGAAVPSLFAGTEGPATAVAIAPDGQTALLGLEDGTIILMDLPSRREILRLHGHTGRVNDITFAPDGLEALSGGADAQVILWDLGSGTPIRIFSADGSGHSGPVRAVDIDPSGHKAVSGGLAATSYLDPGELILWDLDTREVIRRLEGQATGVVAAKFTPDGRRLLASSGDARLFSDQGAGSADSEVGNRFGLYLSEIATGEMIRAFELGGEDVYTLSPSPDGTQVLTGSYYNNTVSLWDIESGELLHTMEGHLHGVQVVAFAPDGQRALSGSYDDSLILWDLSSGKPQVYLNIHQADVLDLAVAPDGRTVLSSAGDGGLVLSDLTDGAEVARFEGHGDMVYDVALVPHRNQMLSGSGAAGLGAPLRDGSIRLWDLDTGAQIHVADLGLQKGVIFQIAVSPDGSTALVATSEPAVRVWDLGRWEETGRLEGHAAWVTGVEFAPDGIRALSSSLDGTLILWDVPRRQVIRRMAGPKEGFWSVAISPDGRTALSDSRDSSLTLWDLETGQRIRDFIREDQPGATGGSGAFLPGGQTALSVDDDGTLLEWDLETGSELRKLGQHPSARTRVVVSPDGQLALSSGMNGSLMLWDLETGELIRRSEGHGVIFDLAVGADGRTALFGSSDTTITEWRLEKPGLEELKAWVGANRYLPGLTCAEREAYQIEPLCSPESE